MLPLTPSGLNKKVSVSSIKEAFISGSSAVVRHLRE